MINPGNPGRYFEIVSKPAAMISVYVISVENRARVASRVDKMDKPFVYLSLFWTCVLLFVAAYISIHIKSLGEKVKVRYVTANSRECFCDSLRNDIDEL